MRDDRKVDNFAFLSTSHFVRRIIKKMAAELAPEIITTIAGFPVTNTVVGTLITDAILLSLVFIVYKSLSLVPKSKLQSLAEYTIESFYNLTHDIAGARAKSIFPYFAAFFIFILFSNIIGLFPGVGSIGIPNPHAEHGGLISFVKPATSDFNTTLALATISLIATHAMAIRYTGIKDYLSRFFSLNPILLFVGILELVSEITKLFSLSFRLFGNIFAGEVVLSTVSGLVAFIAPIPFLMLESIVALVQALVFAMLTMVFMSILTTPHHSNETH